MTQHWVTSLTYYAFCNVVILSSPVRLLGLDFCRWEKKKVKLEAPGAKTIGLRCASAAVWSFWMSRWSCRKSGCAGCLSGSISVAGGREEGAGRGVMHVCCVDSRACAEWGFTGCGPERSRYGVWVTRPIDSSAAESGGAAEKCHSHYRRHSPDSSSNRSAGRRSFTTTAIWNTSSTLIFLHLLRYIRIYTVRLLFTCHSGWGWLIRKKAPYILMWEELRVQFGLVWFVPGVTFLCCCKVAQRMLNNLIRQAVCDLYCFCQCLNELLLSCH